MAVEWQRAPAKSTYSVHRRGEQVSKETGEEEDRQGKEGGVLQQLAVAALGVRGREDLRHPFLALMRPARGSQGAVDGDPEADLGAASTYCKVALR